VPQSLGLLGTNGSRPAAFWGIDILLTNFPALLEMILVEAHQGGLPFSLVTVKTVSF
jgi:hypothetical protein